MGTVYSYVAVTASVRPLLPLCSGREKHGARAVFGGWPREFIPGGSLWRLVEWASRLLSVLGLVGVLSLWELEWVKVGDVGVPVLSSSPVVQVISLSILS